jgi:glycosyltransferase involved in cell wall biosynthesis
MKILFLDQSGKVGGAELSLLDVARPYRDHCLVCLFAEGPFRTLLEQAQIPTCVLATPIAVQKDSSVVKGLSSIGHLMPLVIKVAQLSRKFDLIYANTPKALVVGAIASTLSQRPLVYHLHDIVSQEHFSAINQRLIISLANTFAVAVIANSQATKVAFQQAGGRSPTEVVYNGFDIAAYQQVRHDRSTLRQQLGLESRFIVGHFSRLSPWKGQHILIEALKHCSENVTALFVGDALFGEQKYVEQLHQQIEQEGLQHRVRFLGFRSDVPQLMAACDVVAHTSTAPEPFGRVIVETMLGGIPVIAAAAGGAIELVEPGKTGWLTPPGDPVKLATCINHCQKYPHHSQKIARNAQADAIQRFDLAATNEQIAQCLQQVSQTSRVTFSNVLRWFPACW